MVQSIRFFVDDSEQFIFLRSLEATGEQTRNGRFDRCEWCAEFVRNGVKNGGAQFLILPGRLSLSDVLNSTRAFNRDGYQCRERLKAFVRQSRSGNANCANRSNSQSQRYK